MRGMKSLTIWAIFAAVLSQQLFASVASIKFEDEKTYYSPPDPNAGSPPSGKQKEKNTETHALPNLYALIRILILVFLLD